MEVLKIFWFWTIWIQEKETVNELTRCLNEIFMLVTFKRLFVWHLICKPSQVRPEGPRAPALEWMFLAAKCRRPSETSQLGVSKSVSVCSILFPLLKFVSLSRDILDPKKREVRMRPLFNYRDIIFSTHNF